jgi:HSP20 family protein
MVMFRRLGDMDSLFGNINLLRDRLNSLYSDYDRPFAYDDIWGTQESMPRIILYEDGNNFEIMAEVPGLPKEDLHVKIQGNYLEIAGSRDSDAPKGYRILKSERGSVSFSRSMTLPAEVDSSKVSASLKNGILYMTLPRAESSKVKTITVN